MHIAGGVYRELCESPHWNQLFGSGARAALAVCALSPNSVLHTYLTARAAGELEWLKSHGLTVQGCRSDVDIAFSYFHPLSKPHIQPPISEIPKQDALHVSGETVLRFGYLEGDAIVNAGRAVYDPQTANSPKNFGDNGSYARELAIVVNEEEALAMSGASDTEGSARILIHEQGASIVVVKCGASGAYVYESNKKTMRVPAYRTESVFKVGTGDVFSGMFCHYWGEKHFSAGESADLASRAVATYCLTKSLPIDEKWYETLLPNTFGKPGMILLDGVSNTIGRRYTLEEAKYCLNLLGAAVTCPAIDGQVSAISRMQASVALVVADGIAAILLSRIKEHLSSGLSVIVLLEASDEVAQISDTEENVIVTSDFTSALYQAVWKAIELK